MTPLLLALLSACAPDPCPAGSSRWDDGLCHLDESGQNSSGSDTGGADTGGAPGFPDVDRPVATATWAATDLEAAVSAALADGLPQPWECHDVYLEVLSHGDGGCPGHDTYIDDTHLYGCEATTGYWFSGVSEYLPAEGTDDAGWSYEELEVNGDFMFRDPDGHELEVGGHAKWRHATAPDGSAARITTEHSGTWQWEGHDGWLKDGVSGLYAVELSREAGARQVTVDGAVGFNGVQLSFEEVVLTEACQWAPAGVLRVRDPSGAWHDLDFGGACTGCAEAVFNGEDPVGEVCLDLSTIPGALTPWLEAL